MELKKLLSLRKFPFNQKQVELISKAYEFAKIAHLGQKRKNGEEYFIHCVETAAILVRMGLGSITVSAALLHDVPEDTNVSIEEVKKEFGEEIAFLIEGVTKLGNVRLKGSMEEYYLNNLRKMFLAMAADIRVVLIKLADRLHNLRTLNALPLEKQKRIARESMEIYVPIANRLGINEIKGEMEDLCFRYLDPVNYNKVSKLEKEVFKERSKYTKKAIKELRQELEKNNIKVIDIHGRAKHYYSLYLKLLRYEMDIEKIYDLVAIRIIVPKIADCYEALGIVHKKYKPLIGRIKDYISLPKPNGYRSLHTTVFGPEGKIMEVQIRTERMHDEAEFGIAAHWIYSQTKSWKDFIFKRKSRPHFVPQEEISWVQQLQRWQKETEGKDEEFWRSLKIDFFKNHIFAFTPKGDVIDLPEKATPIDFAYFIHTEVGNRATGCKINGKMVSLDHEIKNGDLVEIIVSKDKKLPNIDWLKFVKTANARSKIKNALRKGGVEVV